MPTTAPFANWSSVASSGDGSKLVAAAKLAPQDGFYSQGFIYRSVDAGATWTQLLVPVFGLFDGWACLVSSADGTKLAAVAVQGSGLIYFSSDSGSTWLQTSAPISTWMALASSREGARLVAVPSAGTAYTVQLPFQLPPPRPPELAVDRGSGNSANVSWLVPSTKFVLEENQDLSPKNWTALVALPMLNFSNLHYQVIVTPLSKCNFYRLRQQ
jgi:photosystem II stability/assembly factor-like uncharacterized protein